MKIAAIDIGTNSFHAVVAQANERGIFEIIASDKETVRLGESRGDMKFLTDAAMERGVDALKRFAAMAATSDAPIYCCATSAVREAQNREVFISRVYDETGIEINVIEGTEEARLIYLGVLQALPVYDENALVIDIGGGSTETVIGKSGKVLRAVSEKLGAIRITRKFFADGIATGKSVKQCRSFIKGEWATPFSKLRKIGFSTACGTSGTIKTIAAMVLAKRQVEAVDRFNGIAITTEEVSHVVRDIIKAKSPEARAKLPGMESKRADIILGGAIVLEEALLGLGVERLVISDFALREGMVLDAYQRTDEPSLYHLKNLRSESVWALAERFDVDKKHSKHVTKLALALFDSLWEALKLRQTDRELLEAAAVLHDCGYYISFSQHHKHGYYLVRNAALPGFSRTEAEIIANVIRYHRKSFPSLKHPNFRQVPEHLRGAVRGMASLLRIAEGLDRQQLRTVRSLTASVKKKRIDIVVTTKNREDDVTIELWGAERKKVLLEELLERDVCFTRG